MNASTPEIIAATIFGIALLHTFSTTIFSRLAHAQPNHAGLWHLLGEVEAVFGFWAFVLLAILWWLSGKDFAVNYLEGRNFTEPMFVFVIMIVAASRPVLQTVVGGVQFAARLLPVSQNIGVYFLSLFLIPLLGSFITEPAAMTLAAMMLRDRFYSQGALSNKLKYATIGVLFVNISIGGTLTHFAAPPVLMVASTWEWDSWFMLHTFGWKSAIAVFTNAAVLTWVFRKELQGLSAARTDSADQAVPQSVKLIHLVFLTGIVIFAHHAVVFMAFFLFFLGYTEAYKHYQDRLILREALMVAFFLSGLVVLGGLQQWWLQSTLTSVTPTTLYYLATALTAITDNAALTYLASLVQGVSPEFKYAVVAGAVTGGGLTIIANAPNPAGAAILRPFFDDESINPLHLFLSAALPTVVAILAFQLL